MLERLCAVSGEEKREKKRGIVVLEVSPWFQYLCPQSASDILFCLLLIIGSTLQLSSPVMMWNKG
jgi:hypothetical protein